MSAALWPWWLGGLALAAVGLAFYLASGKLLAVSGMLGRLVDLPREIELERAEAKLGTDQPAFQAELLAATLAEFGPQSVPEALSSQVAAPPLPLRLSWKAHLAFLLMLFVGGLLGRLSMGPWSVRLTLGETFDRLWGTGWASFAVLGIGGALVGFGTRMAGGCTSGHGLSGCSRLQPGSLVATATFLGTAIGVSLLAAAVLG